MAARARQDPEVSLFPFLSILVCLIGALVLLIVIMTMVQSAMGDGRDIEEVARAREADKLKKELAAKTKELATWKEETKDAEKIKKERVEKEERFVLLRKRLNSSAADKKKLEEEHAALQKQLENMLFQIEAIQKEKPPIQAEIEKLKAEIAKRKINIDAKPKVIVQGSGSGAAGGDSKLFFVECNASGIVVYRPGAEPLKVTTGSIGTDTGYDEFLKMVAATPKSLLLFLMRTDGLGTYNRAAGWAENQFQVRNGKLPLPGQGAVDLSLFQKTAP